MIYFVFAPEFRTYYKGFDILTFCLCARTCVHSAEIDVVPLVDNLRRAAGRGRGDGPDVGPPTGAVAVAIEVAVQV